MSPPTVLLDSAVPLYALGGDSPWLRPCQDLLRAVADQRVVTRASTEMVQEVLHHRLRLSGKRAEAVADCRDLEALVNLLPFDSAVLHQAMELVEHGSTIRGRDAVHAATAIVHGIGYIVSTDPAFDTVPGLTRWTPEQTLANIT